MFLLSVSLSLMASWQLTSVTYLSPATPLVTPLTTQGLLLMSRIVTYHMAIMVTRLQPLPILIIE